MKSADGIIVLTGGTSRIESALQLLREGYASHLLVSGVHEENREQILKFHLREFSDLLDCCVYIDRLARNTFENARESLSWIQKNGYHRLILVTSDYHMPRSLVTFRRIMRSVELIPYSVSSSEVRKMQNIKEWLSFPVMLMIFTEYLKFLFVFLNLCLFFSFC
ncbi:MAG: YdcF family protein [Alphaproteobacteria bacterium]|nr:YdcF family protein [Alphaproteobacteria bacterium]